MPDLFLSYSRQDSAFVGRLHEALVAAGRDPWVDVEGIRPADDFMEAIRTAIDASLAFVFVLSPDSLNSAICLRELEHAVQSNKKLVPIVCRDVVAANAPACLSRLNWISFVERSPASASPLTKLFGKDPFARAVKQLLAAAETDLRWVRAHTRLLQRAVEWNEHGRKDAFLLQGEDLEATLALSKDTRVDPPLNDLQREFLAASSRYEKRVDPVMKELEHVKRMRSDALPAVGRQSFGDERIDLFGARQDASHAGGDVYEVQRLDEDRIVFVTSCGTTIARSSSSRQSLASSTREQGASSTAALAENRPSSSRRGATWQISTAAEAFQSA